MWFICVLKCFKNNKHVLKFIKLGTLLGCVVNNLLSMVSDVAAEKTQKSLFDGIEKFDATRLKHTETQEKNPLPDKDGIFFNQICT